MCSNKNQKLTQELLKNAGERVAKYQSDKATRRFGVKAEPSCSQYDMQLAQFAVDIRSKIYGEANKDYQRSMKSCVFKKIDYGSTSIQENKPLDLHIQTQFMT